MGMTGGFWSPTLPIKTAGGGTPSPSFIQHVASSANPVGIGISGTTYVFTPPNAIGAGNCLTMAMTYPSGSSFTITDNNGNTWPGSPTVSADSGSNVSAIFVLPNANSGVTKITVTFTSSVIPFQYTFTEWTNVATASPANGSHGAANVGGGTPSAGSFTPGNNNTNGGNVILAYCAISGLASGNPSNIAAGSGFALLDADIAWTTGQGFPHASQYLVQTSFTSITPSFTLTGDNQNYNCVAVALKAANAGTPKPAGIHIDRILHISSGTPPGTWNLQFPASGNLRVLTTTSNPGFSGITDNESGSWSSLATVPASMWYSVNKSPNSVLKLAVTTGTNAATSIRFFDISGAAVAPFDTSATFPTQVAGPTVTNAPTITPGAATNGGVVIACLQLGQGPGLAVTSPTGAIFDLVIYPPDETDLDLMENADGNAHLYYANGIGALNFNWTVTNNNNTSAVAATFKAA